MRMYTITDENRAATNANGDADLFELDAAADKPIELVGIRITILTELQEAQEEWLRCKIIRGHATTGNGTAVTPRPVSAVDSAAGFAAEVYGATIASAGTAIDLDAFGVPVRAGEYTIYPAGCSFWTSGADLLVCRLMAGPVDDLNYSLTAWIAEYP